VHDPLPVDHCYDFDLWEQLTSDVFLVIDVVAIAENLEEMMDLGFLSNFFLGYVPD